MMRSCLLTIVIILHWFSAGITTAQSQTIRSESAIPYGFDCSDCIIPFRIDDSSAYVVGFIFTTGEFETPPWGEALLRDPEYRFTDALDTMVFRSEMGSVPPGEHVMIWDGTTQSGLPVGTIPHRYYFFAFSSEPDSSVYSDRRACISLSVSWATGLITIPGWYVKYQPVHFTGIHENDVSKAVIILDKSDFNSLNPPLSIGDEIGIFTRENLCAGAVVLHWAYPLSSYLRFTVFGDDPETIENDGFHEGELLTMKIWDYQENIEYDAIFQCRETEPFYMDNGEYYIISLEVENALQVSNCNDLHSVSLEANYPNPFNTSTTIPFILERASPVKLTVHDINGRIISTLVDNTLPAGKHIVEFNGAKLASGFYIYRLESNGFINSGRMILVK